MSKFNMSKFNVGDKVLIDPEYKPWFDAHVPASSLWARKQAFQIGEIREVSVPVPEFWHDIEIPGGELYAVSAYFGSLVPVAFLSLWDGLEEIVVVGRHAGEIPGYKVARYENITFSTDPVTCYAQVESLLKAVAEEGRHVLFQNIPGTVAVVLGKMHRAGDGQWLPLERIRGTKIGVIISRPGPRVAAATKEFCFMPADAGTTPPNGDLAKEAIAFANGRAKVETDYSSPQFDRVTVTVDPVPPFEFDHIGWL